MSESHQNGNNNSPATTEDVEWVLSKKSKLLIPKYKSQKSKIKVPFDWLNLIGVLLIPFVVTVIGLYATQQITQKQTEASNLQHQTDVQNAKDQQLETILNTYLDDIQNLLLNYHLYESKPRDEVRSIAHTRTLIALRRLDPVRREILIRFLDGAQLIYNAPGINSIQGSDAIISLNGADLEGADLSNVFFTRNDLRFANLKGANLENDDLTEVALAGANLKGANLRNSSLIGANLNLANLENADLRGAFFAGYLDATTDPNADPHKVVRAEMFKTDLRGALISSDQLAQISTLSETIMPDGSIHP